MSETPNPVSDFIFDMEMRNQMLIANVMDVNEFFQDMAKKVTDHMELGKSIVYSDPPKLGEAITWINHQMKLASVMNILGTAVRAAKAELNK